MPKKKEQEKNYFIRISCELDQSDSDFVREDAKVLGCYNEKAGRYQWRKYVSRLIGILQQMINEKR